jgi:serine/threonine protein phosphatase 1
MPTAASPTGRSIAIGDIHGCADALATLLRAVDPRPDDTLIFLGDYVDRGPDSRQVVELLLELQGRCHLVTLLGNHEIMLLDALESGTQPVLWMQSGGRETVDSYGGSLRNVPASHRQFFEQCVRYHETPTHLFLHAGYEPDVPLERQSEALLFWQHILSDVPPPHRSGKIVVGHTPQTSGRIRDLGHLVMIDTYCFGSGWLTAWDVEAKTTWQADKQGRLRD